MIEHTSIGGEAVVDSRARGGSCRPAAGECSAKVWRTDPRQVNVRIPSTERGWSTRSSPGGTKQVVLVDFGCRWCEPCVEKFSARNRAGQSQSGNGAGRGDGEHGHPRRRADKTLEFLKDKRAGTATNLISQ